MISLRCQRSLQIRVQKLLNKPAGAAAAAEAAADTSIVVAAAASAFSGSATLVKSGDDSSLNWHSHVMHLTNPLARETAQLYADHLHILTLALLSRLSISFA
jgi:hypothetical protein